MDQVEQKIRNRSRAWRARDSHAMPCSATAMSASLLPHATALQPPCSRRRLLVVPALSLPLLGGLAGSARADEGLQALLRRGTALFKANDVAGSAAAFDAALKLAPRVAPFLWQRGIALYYAKRYAEGAKQFRDDATVNKDDTEESIWAFVCEAQTPGGGFDAARAALLPLGRDSRAVMRAAYDVFSGAGTLETLRAQASASPSNAFYSQLYEALYQESRGDTEAARISMLGACDSAYAREGESDFMVSVARVHVAQRGWLKA